MDRVITPLSEREKQVLTLCAEGHTTSSTGKRLHLSEAHIKGIHGLIKPKLGAVSMSHSVAIAIMYGLIQPEV